MSPDSVEQAAALGARLMTFSQQPWELYAEGTLAEYRKAWSKNWDVPPPPPLTGDLMFCHADPKQAEEYAKEYMCAYFLSIVQHYEIMSDHFKDTKGYDHYATAGEAFKAAGIEAAAWTIASPDDIEAAIRYLVSPGGSYVTGAILPVDGGLALV